MRRSSRSGDVLFVVLSGFGFCVLSEAADEDDFVEHGVWLRFFWFVRCLRYMLAQRVCRRYPLPRRLDGICGKGPSLPGARSPHLQRRAADFGRGERASEGRGCLERGTLNADRKANRKGAREPPCLTALPQGASSESQLRNSKSQSRCNRGERQRDLKHRCLLIGPSPRLLHSSSDVGISLRRSDPARCSDDAHPMHASTVYVS
jgi:hypothetical protein